MKNAISILFLSLFIIKCSVDSSYNSNSHDTIDKESSSWPIFLNFEDYTIEDFWSKQEDSSLFIIINDFDRNNRDLQLIDLQSKISSAYYKINSSDLYPKLSLDVTGRYGEQNLAGLGLSDDLLESIQGEPDDGGDGVGNETENNSSSFGSSSYTASLNTFWEIDLWGKIRNMNASQKAKMLSDLHDLEYAKISLKAQFVKSYILTINTNNEIKIFEENLSNLKKIKDITESRIVKGLSSPNEIHLASSNYFLYESNLLTKNIELKSSKRRLELMLGRYPSGTMALSFIYPSNMCDIKSKLTSDLILRRPDVASRKEKLNASNSKLVSSRRALFPSFSLTNSIGQSSSDLENLFDPKSSVWNVGVNILQPIFQSGRLKKNIEISEYEFSYSDIEYLESVMNAFYETENFLDLDANLKEVQNKINLSVDNIQKAVNYGIRSYELGLVDLVYVLNLQQQLFNTKIQLENIIARRYLNRIDLMLALGGDFEY